MSLKRLKNFWDQKQHHHNNITLEPSKHFLGFFFKLLMWTSFPTFNPLYRIDRESNWLFSKMDSRFRGNDVMKFREWRDEVSGMMWWSFGNDVVKFRKWRDEVSGMTWWSFGNDVVKFRKWRDEVSGMTWWSFGNDVMKFREWRGEIKILLHKHFL